MSWQCPWLFSFNMLGDRLAAAVSRNLAVQKETDRGRKENGENVKV